MTEYLVMIPDDEAKWDAKSQEERDLTFAQHREFARLLEDRGHKVVHGAALVNSREAKTLRTSADGGTTVVTDGPYAEAVEQLSGFYLVDSDDLGDLLEICKALARAERLIEVRALASGGH